MSTAEEISNGATPKIKGKLITCDVEPSDKIRLVLENHYRMGYSMAASWQNSSRTKVYLLMEKPIESQQSNE